MAKFIAFLICSASLLNCVFFKIIRSASAVDLVLHKDGGLRACLDFQIDIKTVDKNHATGNCVFRVRGRAKAAMFWLDKSAFNIKFNLKTDLKYIY